MGERKDRVLVVDDDLALAETLADGLGERGYDAIAVGSSREAVARLGDPAIDALVTDLRMPQVDGMGLLATSRRVDPDRPVIVMTAYSAVETAIDSIRQGACHYLTKPFKVDELALFLSRALDDRRVRREATALRKTLSDRFGLQNLVGRGAEMQRVAEIVMRVAATDVPVLVTGETGTGKGLVARAIHAHGNRARGPFVAINCAALPDTLLESELFGHVRGAFTGATSNRAGLFVEADGGTLFLDEVGEMSAAMQAKLLRVLESGRVRAVGSNKEASVDVRVVAATHRDLRERVRQGTFREDLLYRLDVVGLELPPLRRRREDLPELVDHFLAAARARHPQSPVHGFDAAATARLLAHGWPGNVRELEHVVERVVLLARGPSVTVEDLPATLGAVPSPEAPPYGTEVLPMREVQRRYATWAYEQLGARKHLTAERLGIDVKTLGKWLQADSASDEPRSS